MNPEQIKKEFSFLRSEIQANNKLMEMQQTMLGLVNARVMALLEVQKEILTRAGDPAASATIKAIFERSLQAAADERGKVYGPSSQSSPPGTSGAGRN